MLLLALNVNGNVIPGLISIWLRVSKVGSCRRGDTVCYCAYMNSRAYCPLIAGAASLSDSCPLWPTKDSSQSTDRLASFSRFPLIDFIDQSPTCVSCHQRDWLTLTMQRSHENLHISSPHHFPQIFLISVHISRVRVVCSGVPCRLDAFLGLTVPLAIGCLLPSGCAALKLWVIFCSHHSFINLRKYYNFRFRSRGPPSLALERQEGWGLSQTLSGAPRRGERGERSRPLLSCSRLPPATALHII